MNAFEFRDRLVGDCSTFSRSFTQIWPDDVRQFLDKECDSRRYWPAPLIRINPSFLPADTVEELCKAREVHPAFVRFFRVNKSTLPDGVSVRLYRRRREALAIARRREGYVLTTGTRFGKSMYYFIPIVNRALHAKAMDKTPCSRGDRRFLDERPREQSARGVAVIPGGVYRGTRVVRVWPLHWARRLR